jgi:hypothetical protein
MKEKDAMDIKDMLSQLEARCEERCKNLEVKIAELKADTTYQRGLDREKIKMFDDYMDLKGKGRRDYDNLAIKLKHEILRRRRRGMDYRDVVILFGFKSPMEAYRVIERTKEMFPEDVITRIIKNTNRSKKMLCPR